MSILVFSWMSCLAMLCFLFLCFALLYSALLWFTLLCRRSVWYSLSWSSLNFLFIWLHCSLHHARPFLLIFRVKHTPNSKGSVVSYSAQKHYTVLSYFILFNQLLPVSLPIPVAALVLLLLLVPVLTRCIKSCVFSP